MSQLPLVRRSSGEGGFDEQTEPVGPPRMRVKSPLPSIVAGLMVLAVGVALCCAGCSAKDAAKPVDSGPFEAAIADYLHNNSYGMKIASVQSIDQNGNIATVVCKMQEAEGTYGLHVTWQFALHRSDGHWQVDSYTAK